MTRERYCLDCGGVFEAANDQDRLCKSCLLKRHNPRISVGPTLADATGERRLRKLKERSGVINEQIAELKSKRRLIWWEIVQIRAGALVDWILETVGWE